MFSASKIMDAFVYVLQDFKKELMEKPFLEYFNNEENIDSLKYVHPRDRPPLTEVDPKVDVKCL